MAGSNEPFNTEKLAEDLVFVKKEGSKGTSYGGWKRDLFVTRIDSPTEEKLLICTLCHGVLRDPYAVTVSQDKEPRCSVCLPKKKALITIADLIRSAINELDVSISITNFVRKSGYVSFYIIFKVISFNILSFIL